MPPISIKTTGFLLLVYLGTVCYTIAAYYHLKLGDHWSFWKAYAIAIPFVLVEYAFSLHGNYFLNHISKLSPIHILLITMSFYFVNLWILNVFVLKNKIDNILIEGFCFALILTAFGLSTAIQNKPIHETIQQK